MTWPWGLLAAAALLWPDRVAGPFDGVPLERAAEALLVGVLVPTLWWFHPRFLSSRLSRACIIALLSWRALSTLALNQEGWCVRFEPSRPYVSAQTGIPHSWDIRADWRAPNPTCSAIMTRPYETMADFPAWFFNLPPDNESWPGPLDRPPGATTRMIVSGYLHAAVPGALRIDRSEDVHAVVSVDGGGDADHATLAPGTHHVAITATLTGERWRLVPLWNEALLWRTSGSGPVTTVRRPAMIDRLLRPVGSWFATALVVLFATAWVVAAIAEVRDRALLGWCAASSVILAGLVATDHPAAARLVVAALGLAAVVPIRPAFRNQRGLYLMVGIPWFTYVCASAFPAIGHFVLYDAGHDYWMFQRFAYRIVMQGRWLEGGSATFWFQPFYRWIVGLLHVIFGDSSVGEWFWDAACLLGGALFSYRIVRESASHSWSVVAAVLPLAIFVLGTPQYLIGRGLGEISSMGFLSAAGLFAMRSRLGRIGAAILAGALMSLAFYTRLNNLAVAAGVVALSLHGRRLLRSRLRSAATIAGVVILGLFGFAWRNWYYTGAFSLFYGTQKDLLAIWQRGMPLGTVVRRMSDSVLMVLTVNDPPRFDVFSVPVVVGAATALVVALRISPFNRIRPATAVFFFSAIAGALVARGSAYPGRFSMHVLPITCALAVAAVACVTATVTPARRTSAARSATTSSNERSNGPTPLP